MKVQPVLFFILATVLSVSVLFLIFNRKQKVDESIQIIVPNNYRGLSKIIKDETQGIEVQVVNGKRRYNIPANGVLRVNSFLPFEEWHEEFAFFLDGTPLRMSSKPSEWKHKFKKNEIALFGGSITEGTNYPLPTIVYVIGTESDYIKYVDERK